MNKLVGFVLILTLLPTTIVLACTCLELGGEIAIPNKIQLTIINCDKSCNAAVTIENDFNFYMSARLPDNKAIIFPSVVRYDSNNTEASAMVQQKFQNLPGIYKIVSLTETPPDNSNATSVTNITQLSDKPDADFIKNQGAIYQNELEIYQAYINAPNDITDTIYYVGLIALIAYFALLLLNSIYLFFKSAQVGEDTISTLLNKSLDIEPIPYVLFYFFLQSLMKLITFSLELNSIFVMTHYRWVSVAYVLYTLCFIYLFYRLLFKSAKINAKSRFISMYLLQRSLLIIALGWGFAYTGTTIFLLQYILLAFFAFLFSLIHKANSESLSNQSKSLYLKSQSYLYMLLFFIPILMLCIVQFSARLSNYIILNNFWDIMQFYLILMIVPFVYYITLLKRAGLTLRELAKRVLISIFIVCIIPIASGTISTSSSCNCDAIDQSMNPQYQYIAKYKEYAIQHGIVVELTNNHD